MTHHLNYYYVIYHQKLVHPVSRTTCDSTEYAVHLQLHLQEPLMHLQEPLQPSIPSASNNSYICSSSFRSCI